MKKEITGAITLSKPRETIRVTLDRGTVLEGRCGTTVETFLTEAETQGFITFDSWLIACICNGRLRELSYPLYSDALLKPVYLNSTDGGRIYRRSLVLLLTAAIEELYPGAKASINYAIPDGGYYCELNNRATLTEEEIARLEAHMRQIVENDDPIDKQIVPLDEAIKLFKSRHDDDKVRLLEYRSRDELVLYTLRGHADYYFGYMVPSTGYLKTFKLICEKEGFILQYPRRENPMKLSKIRAFSKLSEVFHQSDEWLDRLGVADIGQLNHLARNDEISELILVNEALHEQNVAQISTEICERHSNRGARIILIAGPTSAGKTTFSKRLAIQLLAHSLRPFTLEMDNYFVDREHTPRNERGEYDFESIHALNLDLFNRHLIQLMEGEKVQLPRFNFHLGKSVPGDMAQLRENQIVIIEGIHGLNPELVPNIPPDKIFRVYVSALTQLNIDRHNRVPTTDLRLLRRIIRDARSRGYNAAQTLEMWQNVRDGEKRNIFPYQENADMMFNSALAYELAALRPLVEPLLLQVEYGTPQHIEAHRLLSFLNWVQPMTNEQRSMIPDTSLLREFIGGSILENYHPGKPHD